MGRAPSTVSPRATRGLLAQLACDTTSFPVTEPDEFKYGVHDHQYWCDERSGKVFCVVDAPDAAAAQAVHREPDGLVADEIIPVQEGQ